MVSLRLRSTSIDFYDEDIITWICFWPMLDASWPTRLRAHDAAFFFPLNADRKDARPPKRKRNKVIGTHEGHTHSPCEQQCPFDFSQAGMEMGRAGPASEGPSPPPHPLPIDLQPAVGTNFSGFKSSRRITQINLYFKIIFLWYFNFVLIQIKY